MPPPSLFAVSCSWTAQPREEKYVGFNVAGFLFLAVVAFCSGWLVLIGVVQTVLWRAMPTAWPGRAEKIQSVPRQKSFRDATKSVAKTTKHVHTGHQAASLNMYPSCATSFARAPPRFEDIYAVSLHHDDMVVMEISSIHCTFGM